MDVLFPPLPEDITALTDEELSALLEEHDAALSKVEAADKEYIGDLAADQVIEQTKAGVEQIKALRAESDARAEAAENFTAEMAALVAEARGTEEEPEAVEEELAVEVEALAAEDDPEPDPDAPDPEDVVVEQPAVEEPVLVAAAVKRFALPPEPSAARRASVESEHGTALVAASGLPHTRSGVELDALGLAKAMISEVGRRGSVRKSSQGTEERILVASASFPFPEERVLKPRDQGNALKIAMGGSPFVGGDIGLKALVASGGLCAPLTPFYDIPNFAVTDRPVRDALPSYRAERGGVSVPSVGTIGSIETAITVVEEEDDALGGTFATKSCQDLTCPTWTDVAVGAIAHCREYGNFNQMAWPEGIAFENALTMAAWARTAERRLLDRIKSLSIEVTQAAIGAQLNAYASLVYSVTRMEAGVRNRLRLPKGVRYRALFPEWVPDLLAADSGSTQFTRYDAQAAMQAHLEGLGITIGWYKDGPSTGTSQDFAAETAGAIDDFPDDVQYAFFVEGEFLHLDGGTLELGIVRDSTLNSTNDYQVFGESFENIARVGPTQGALWATVDVCPSGGFPALISGLTC